MIINPKLNSLKQKIVPKPITNYRGIIFGTDESALHAMGTINGKVVFKSGLEMTFQQYRGQVEDYPICNANLYRTSDYKEIFLQICRTIAFEKLLDKHPYIRLLKKVKYADGDIYVNTTAIAQHYELQTPYLDLTSSFDVASFFATSIYDPNSYSYQPYTSNEKTGVIYVYNEIAHMNLYKQADLKFEYIGWQGLPRPEEQKASIYHLQNNEDFNRVSGVKKYKFKHSPSTSKKIWNKFDKGKILFPNDAASELANKAKTLFTFTSEELQLSKGRFLTWTNLRLTDQEFKNMLDELKINIIEEPLLKWGSLMDIEETYWINKINQVFTKAKTRMTHFLY